MTLCVPKGVDVFEVDPVFRRDEWMQLRRNGVTASEIAALFQQHPYLDMATLLRRKLKGDPDKPSSYMLAGREHEPGIALRLAWENRNWRVERPQVFLRHRATGLGCTLDGTVREIPGDPEKWLKSLEIKSASRREYPELAKRAKIYARMQALVGAMLLDADGALVVVGERSGYGQGGMTIHEVKRHSALERAIYVKAAAFKKRIEELRAR